MKVYCACCGKESARLSMKALCERCQKVKGALSRRVYDIRTGKLRPKKEQVSA